MRSTGIQHKAMIHSVGLIIVSIDVLHSLPAKYNTGAAGGVIHATATLIPNTAA